MDQKLMFRPILSNDSTCEINPKSHSGWTIWAFLGLLLAFRVAYLAIVPFDLIHDEAYYWDWSRNLDYCYYSKPPGIAWLIAAVTHITGANTFSVRLPAAILSVVPIGITFALGKRMFDQKTGIVAALLLSLTPGNVASGVMMTIDAPFLCCWSIALYGYWRMLERDSNRLLWSMVTVLAVGTGLLFKQTMLAFPVLAGTFALVSAPDRQEWRRPSFWLTGLSALGFLAPLLWWNVQHDWITFEHTGDHFARQHASTLRRIAVSAEFLASQFGLLSPVTYSLLGCCLFLSWKNMRKIERREAYLLCFFAPPIACVLLLSLTQRVEANWPAPFYASAIVLLAAAVMDQLACIRLPKQALQRSLAVGCVSILITYALPFGIVGFGLKGTPVDIAVRMWGWQELGQQVHVKLEEQAANELPILVTADRGVTAELAFYLPTQPHVRLWDANESIDSQYDIWGLPSIAPGQDLVIVGREQELPTRIASEFSHSEAIGNAEVKIGRKRSHRFNLWIARGYRGHHTASATSNRLRF